MNDQLPAIPHPFPDSRTDASHWIRDGEDVPRALELFRVAYEQAKKMAERRKH
jgi:hypothetical protein